MIVKRTCKKCDRIVLLLVLGFLFVIVGAAGSSGREQAQRVVCQTHLKSWFEIIEGIVQENDGRFLSGVNSFGYYWPWQLPDSLKDWTQNEAWFCPKATKPIYDRIGNQLPGISPFQAWGVFTDTIASVSGYESGPNGINGSYGLNGYLLNIPDDSEYWSGVPAKQGWRRFERITQTSEVPVMLDALRFDLWPLEHEAPAESEFSSWSAVNHMARVCINRHQGFISSAFADGSARKVGLKELYVLKWHQGWIQQGRFTLAGGVAERPEIWPEWIRDYPNY